MLSLDRLLDRLQQDLVPAPPGFEPHTNRIAVVLESGDAALNAAAVIARRWLNAYPASEFVAGAPSAAWPFLGESSPPQGPAVIWMPELHEAFVNRQTAGTRLVTTQAGYQLLAWLAQTAGRDVLLLATADRSSVEEHAPELIARRGALSGVHVSADSTVAEPEGERHSRSGVERSSSDGIARAAAILADAFRSRDPGERLALCVRALEHGRTPSALLAAASVCMEVNDLEAARRDLDDALAAAPDWAAVHFERGKLWLRRDDMAQASRSFRAAAERLPAFGSAWANLGATLGELDRPADALQAFERALECDPRSHQALNNIGVVKRELGRLPESEAAFRQVIALAPTLAFGYYNLGHTLFLQGRYQAALSAYSEGQQRDVERNPVQASRLALCRLASGDPEGALAELKRAVSPLPADYRRQLLADTGSILMALLTHRPDLAGWDRVNAWVAMELRKLA